MSTINIGNLTDQSLKDTYMEISKEMIKRFGSLFPSEPESPQEFKEGQWLYYESIRAEGIFRSREKQEEKFSTVEAYGIRFDNTVFYPTFQCNYEVRPYSAATPEQIERILSAVAKSKGFGYGTNTDAGLLHSGIFEYDSKDQLWHSGVIVYAKGKWAKIVDQDKPEDLLVSKEYSNISMPDSFIAIPLSKTEDLESLPERWAIERTEKNHKKVNNWINQHHNEEDKQPYGDSDQFIHYPLHNKFHMWNHIQPGYTLITDEQFDKWVLNKPESTNMVQDASYKAPNTIQTSTVIMEDKAPLTIEEKKAFHLILNSEKESVYSIFNEVDSIELEKLTRNCAPLFHTSIDNVPVWRTDSVWYNKDGIATEFVIPETESYTLDGRKSASTHEACERWINDNRMVKVSEVLSLVDKLCNNQNEFNRVLYASEFKEELSKLTRK